MYNDPDPTPDSSNDSHGTSCAGEIAMIKDSACGVGVAYNCSIAGMSAKQTRHKNYVIAIFQVLNLELNMELMCKRHQL